MSIWQKLAGTARGMVRNGPIGALLGGNRGQDGPAEEGRPGHILNFSH